MMCSNVQLLHGSAGRVRFSDRVIYSYVRRSRRIRSSKYRYISLILPAGGAKSSGSLGRNRNQIQSCTGIKLQQQIVYPVCCLLLLITALAFSINDTLQTRRCLLLHYITCGATFSNISRVQV